ncbi:MAG: hypothetical protein ACT4OJ_04610 [Bacteroidota bacterium]
MITGNFRKKGLAVFTVACFFVLHGYKAVAQNLGYRSKITIALTDGSLVTLYAQLDGSGKMATDSKNYYYLPTQVLLAKDPRTKTPQFQFLNYVTEQREDQGGVSGALMHFLMQSGFTPEQLADMQAKLAAKIPGAIVKGPVDLFAASDASSFTITSAVVSTGGGMTKSLVTSGKAPLQQGGKVAVAANLDKNGAQLLAATFEKTSSITDLSVNLFYKYFVKVNGLKATFTIDYVKMEEVIKRDRISGKYTEDGHWFSQDEQTQTWTEIHKLYERMVEEKAITIDIDEGLPNETTAKITEMLFQLFLSLVATPAPEKPQAPPPTEEEKAYLPGKNTAYEYKLRIVNRKNSKTTKKDVVHLNYDYMMPMELAVTQNLKTFYDAVRDNKSCIASVLIGGDNFYKHMDIRFVLDLEAKEMFDQEINYVTVNVKKKRNSGNDFTDRRTIDKQYMTEKGITASMTYAAGEDKNADMYEYMTQWSLRGGNVYPATPKWEKGQMEAVTLRPPVSPRLIEFEADLEKLKSTGISRITLQVRYKKYNEEIEENINVSPTQGQALAGKMLFMDRDTRGYVYRLIFNHITEGKLALPWSVKINDNYVYAVIPDELNNKTSALFINAAETAKTIVPAGADGKVMTDKVLDQFKEVLNAPKTN